jgi:PAS domain S-box-containing protein
MPESLDMQHRTSAFYTRGSLLLAALIAMSAGIALYCRYAGWTPLETLFPQLQLFKANAALALLCAAAALALQGAARPGRLGNALARMLALITLSIGAATLLQDFSGTDFGVDQLLFVASGETTALHPGRMSPLIALGLILAGAALLTLDKRTAGGHYPAEYCAMLLGALMFVPLIGTLYSAAGMVRIASSSDVAPHVAAILLLLAAGTLAARPEHPVMSLWNHAGPGGRMLRRLLPNSLLLLLALDLLVEWGSRQGFYGPENISPLVILLSGVWLSVLFWRAASMLNREFDVRRKGEAALIETSALLRAVSDNTPDPIFVKDRAGRVVFANPATFRMLGKTSMQVMGRSSADIYGERAEAEAIDAHDRIVMEKGQADAVEETLTLPYGTRTFYTTKAPWINDRGEVVGLVGISTDITERKQMEDALKAHETQLEALVAVRTAEVSELIGHLESTREEEKRAIARELHDDLGSALTALNMHLAIMFQKMPAEPAFTERSVQIKALLNSVTQTTRRIQLGLRPDKLDIFGIKTAIAEQALEFENYTGVTCRTSLPDEELAYPPQLDIALYRMVQESLNNIAKHARATSAEIILDDTEQYVTLTIRDNGVGMSNPHPAGTQTHGMRGMRERAGYLGGDIRVISAPGQGTCITITVPKNSTATQTTVSGVPLAHAVSARAGTMH